MKRQRSVGCPGSTKSKAAIVGRFKDGVAFFLLLTPVLSMLLLLLISVVRLDLLPDMGEPLDTNKELNTVGWSNILSGLTGGFTGR